MHPMRLLFAGGLLALSAAGLVAATAATSAPAATKAGSTVTTPAGASAVDVGRVVVPRLMRRLSFPANALSRGSGGDFGMHARGVEWNTPAGAMSLTIRRPSDYADGPVRVTLVYQTSTDEGTLVFNITPITFRNGSGFETYAALSTPPRVVSGDPSLLLTSSATIVHGDNTGFGTGPWWYIEIQRAGDFAGRVRLMSVALSY